MKILTIVSFILILSVSGFSQAYKSTRIVSTRDSVVMGAGYANDIFYSFENGIVGSAPRTNWDIGIRTTLWTASIITNGAAGVNLYTYPNSDTTGWSTVDTAGIAGWTILYDSEKDWEEGAFDRSETGHPDYGWGKYNPINHDVVGDSIYILKALDGSYKKIWIIRKNSSNNKYFIRTANLDGSNDKVTELDINTYRNVNFIYYAFSSESIIEREPDTASWDVLFTKYIAIQPDSTPYPVVGVLSNFKTYSNEFNRVGPDFLNWTSQPLDSSKSPVGWEWKKFDMDNFTWTVDDSTAFFIQTRKNDIYKLVFKNYEGSNSGKIVFEKASVSLTGIGESSPGLSAVLYPNPVRDHLNIVFDGSIQGKAFIAIFDMTGKQVFSTTQDVSDKSVSVRLPESILSSGLHMVKVETENGIFSSKFMVYNR